MQKSAIFIFFFFGISLYTFAQVSDNCNCSLNLKEIIKDIENNYPGYKAKTNNGSLSTYQAAKERALKNVIGITDRENCFYLIEEYLNFFKDNHIIFSDSKTTPKQASVKDLSMPDEKGSPDRLTGTWRRRGDSLTIKIIYDSALGGKHLYRGYILKSKDASKIGYVHFALIGNENEFRIRRYSSRLTTDLLRGRRLNNLLIEPSGIWEKLSSEISHRPKRVSSPDNDKFTHKLLNDNTYYIGIPSFTTNEKKFDSLIVHDIIPAITANKTEHLVIDLRNNVGGNSSFLSLIRFIYEKPTALPGDFILSTESMIKRHQRSADAGSAYHQKMLPRLIDNIGGFVQRDSLHIKLKDIYEYPKTVAIIVNENCASSTEYFLIIAKRSSKVKVFGRHTAGTLDYSELLGPEKLPCASYRYMRPTTMSFWTPTAPIDNKGIIPDVDLSKYPDNEWLDLVIH